MKSVRKHFIFQGDRNQANGLAIDPFTLLQAFTVSTVWWCFI